MKIIARWNLSQLDLRMLAVLGLALVLAACNNGGNAAY
jgi:hypothetical protein